MQAINNFIFTFRNKCNMNCKFCFIPFVDKSIGNLNLWKEIIDHLFKFNPQMITFGGGDPFIFPGFLELLKYAKQYNILVQVDTNGLNLKPHMYDIVENYIDLLGLPIDGVGEVHDNFRQCEGHFNIVLQHLKKLSTRNCKIKINSVITTFNYKSLIELASLLNDFNFSCWSLHEFCFYENINSNKYKLDDQLILDTANKIKNISKNKVQFIRLSEVKNQHIFISSNGDFYITDTHCQNKYLELGNFQDPGIMKTLEKHVDQYAVAKRYDRKIYESNNSLS